MEKIKSIHAKGIFLVITMGFLLISQSYYVAGWESGYVLMSSPADAPTLDGKIDNDWRGTNINKTYGKLSEDITIQFYVLHNVSAIYFAIRVDVATTNNDESLILYFSKNASLEEEKAFDKKVVMITNATGSQNASITAKKDYYRDVDSDEPEATTWIEDTSAVTWNVSVGKTELTYRVYEFQIPLTPENDQENVKMTIGSQYTIVIGFARNHELENELKTPPLVLQVGPKSGKADDEIGEFKIDKEKFIMWTEIVLAIIIAMFGVVLISTKVKVGSLKLPEDELEAEREEPKKSDKKGGKK